MNRAERERLQELYAAFLSVSGPRRKDGKHCDHCGAPVGIPHMTFCRYERVKQELEAFIYGEQKAEEK